MNSTTGPGRPVATYLRDWRTLGGIRPSGLAFFSECHPVHTRRSPGTGWLDKPVKADIATSHDKRGGSCCLAAAFDFLFWIDVWWAWSLRIANNVSSIHFISQNGMPFWLKDQNPDPSRSKTFKAHPPLPFWSRDGRCGSSADASSPTSSSTWTFAGQGWHAQHECQSSFHPEGHSLLGHGPNGGLGLHHHGGPGWPMDTPALARQHAARDLQFVNDDHGWTAELRALISMKMFQCVRLAKETIGETPTGLNLGRDHPALPAGKATGLDTVCDRRQILIEWDRMAQQPRPKLTYQGSDNFLKKQFKLCALGEIGFFQTKNIISALPDTDEKPIKVKRKATFDGWEREIEEEERAFPTTKEQIKKMHQVFRNNLYMCLISFPQHPQFNVTKTDLDDWYEWFWGKDIADRKPPPSEQTLIYAERNAWREIHHKVYEGSTLRDAMQTVRQDSLFWTREVYERCQVRSSGNTVGKGKFKGQKSTGWSPKQPQWTKGSSKSMTSSTKGKGKSKSKDKGKSKPTWPSTWATSAPNGTPFCRDFHLKKTCQGNCGRSHNCPVMKDGWVCNAPQGHHSPNTCPHKWLGLDSTDASCSDMDPGPQATPVAFVRGEGLASSGASGPDRGPVQSPQSKPASEDKKSSPPNDIPQSRRALTQWNGTDDSAWEALQQWLQFVPQRLHERLRWHGGHSHLPPRDETNLLLYAGKDDETSLDSCLRHLFPSMTPTIVALDIRRDGKEVEHDLLRDQPYNDLCRQALAAHLAGTGGGPNCRTWSILRWIPKPGAPPPVRGRKEPHCWGLDSLKASDQQLVDDDSVLLLRQMVITHLASLGRRHRGLPDPWNFLEHPVDPKHNSMAPSAWRCSSIWATRALRTWHHLMGNTFLTFDQCRLGQVVKKTTTLTTNLHLTHWEGMVCNHSPEAHKQSESLSSSDLSRYPWAMMQGLATAIHEHHQETPDLRSSQQPCSAAASGADHSKETQTWTVTSRAVFPLSWGTSPPAGTGHTSTPPDSRTAKTRTEGMNSAEGATRESQALGTNLDEHPTNQGAVPQHPNSASGTSREMDSKPRQDGGIPPHPTNNSQRLTSACGLSREEPSGNTHKPTVGHGLTSGGSPPQVGDTPQNPNSACGTFREGVLGVSSYATNHSGLDRPSYLPTTARLHLLDDQMLVPLGFRVRPLRDGGGKTSPGRVPPPLRPPSPLAEKGRLILTKVQSLTGLSALDQQAWEASSFFRWPPPWCPTNFSGPDKRDHHSWPTLLPGRHPRGCQTTKGCRPELPSYGERRGPPGGHDSNTDQPRHMAHQGRAQGGGSDFDGPTIPHRTSQLQLGRAVYRGHQSHFPGRKSTPNGGGTFHHHRSGELLWLHSRGTLPRTYGGNWWGGQDPYDLWWFLGWGECPYPEKHGRMYNCTHSDGLCTLHTLAPGSTGNSPTWTGRCHGPWYLWWWADELGMAYPNHKMEHLEGRCHQGS